MIGRHPHLPAFLVAAALAGCAGQEAEVEETAAGLDQAALLTASCTGCHATGGSVEGISSLTGKTALQLEASLLGYRNDPDGGTAMHRMARGYSEEQIAVIAAALGD